MSKQEKIAWVSLVGITLISFYFLNKLMGLGPDFDIFSREMRRIIQHVISLSVVFYIITYSIQQYDSSDSQESDARIKTDAKRIASIFIEVTLILGILALVFGPENFIQSLSSSAIAHILLGVLIASNIVKYLSQVILYRTR